MTATPLLDRIASVDDLRRLPEGDLQRLAGELRAATIGAAKANQVKADAAKSGKQSKG